MSDSYAGMAFPWTNAVTSYVESKGDTDVLKTSITCIVLTAFGERPMLPEFGSALASALFEPADDSSASTIARSVRDAIARWDDRVEVIDVRVVWNETAQQFDCSVIFKDKRDPVSVESEVALAIGGSMV